MLLYLYFFIHSIFFWSINTKHDDEKIEKIRSLAATVAVEVAGNNTLTTSVRGLFGLNPTTVDILPGDIDYLIGREDCDTSPNNDNPTLFNPFNALDGWDVISQDLKFRFGLASNSQVVALIGGGHSVGRGHSEISGFNSGWDISLDTIDNDFYQTLINTEPVAILVGLNLDWFQARSIDNDRPDLILANNNKRTKRQWLVNIPIDIGLAVPVPRFFKYFNSDLSMAFDLRKYINNDLANNITCHTDAFSVCDQDSIVLIDGFEDEYYYSGSSSSSSSRSSSDSDNENVCAIKQCPLQCPDGKGGFERFNSIDLNNLDDDTDCIRAIVQKFANDNQLFTSTFVTAFTEMIKTGYKYGNVSLTEL